MVILIENTLNQSATYENIEYYKEYIHGHNNVNIDESNAFMYLMNPCNVVY